MFAVISSGLAAGHAAPPGPGHRPAAVARRADRPRHHAGRVRFSATPHFSRAPRQHPSASPAQTGSLPEPPFAQCPAIGDDTSCGILIDITSSGTYVLTDPSQGPFDGDDDTLVGVVNNSSGTVSSLSLTSNTGAFAFDGDGICSGDYGTWDGSAACPYGTTGYEGPNTTFADVSADDNNGVVQFTNPVGPGGVAYFSLESALSSASLELPESYAALGDSYSAGNGTFDGNLDPACDRGKSAWPELVAQMDQLSLPDSAFLACSGATSSQIDASQVFGSTGLASLTASGNEPDVITVTAGGDDLDFPLVLKACIGLGYVSITACPAIMEGIALYLNSSDDFVLNLTKLYLDIEKTAPDAQLDVVGYPLIFPVPSLKTAFTSWFNCSWLNPLSLVTLYQVELDLDDAIAEAAYAAGANFLPTTSSLAGHELCTSKPWIVPPALKYLNSADIPEIGHPTVEGQQALAATVSSELPTFPSGSEDNVLRQLRGLRGSAGHRLAMLRHILAVPNQGGAPVISSSGLAAGTTNVSYLGFLEATGGTAPYTWSVTSGSLPSGLSLDASTGIISGTPTSAGTSDFTVQATDSSSPAQTATQAVSITVSAPPALSVTTTSVPPGTVGQPYSTSLAATGGLSPDTWSVSSGSLPAGLALSPAGVISGTPTTAGKDTFTVEATDSETPAATATESLTLTTTAADSPLTVDPAAPPGGQQGSPYTAQLTSTGGSAPVRWSVTSGTLPAGLTLAATTGVISGIATTSGTYPIKVEATPRATPSQDATASLTLKVSAAPALTALTSSLPGGTLGTPYSATMNAAGGVAPYSWSVSSGSLPPGLSLDPGSGTISGTPAQAGSYPVTITGTDSSTPTAQTVSVSTTISVANSPVLVASSVPAATEGEPYSASVTAGGGLQPYSWAITAGSLPDGLSLDPGTGAITGTPTTPGTYPVTIAVTDSSQPDPQTTSADLTLTVNPPPALSVTSTTLTGAVLGDGYREPIGFTGGTGPYTWSVTAGSLPPGLSIESSTGAIWGTPSQTGSYQFTVSVTDSSTPTPQTASANLAIDVGSQPALALVTGPLPDAGQGSPYSASVQATGGTSPYTYSISGGSLPAGITLDGSTGALTGTATQAGQFSFAVTAQDSSTPTPQTATADFSLEVDTSPPPTVITATLPAGSQGATYSQTLAAAGGVAPYQWSVSAGKLPAGLKLNPSAGTIAGTALSYGTYNFTIQVADSSLPAPQTATQALTLTINPGPALAITTKHLANATKGTAYLHYLSATGGAGTRHWSIKSGKLPAGLKLSKTGGYIYGTPTAAGVVSFTVEVADQSSPAAQTATQKLTITVKK